MPIWIAVALGGAIGSVGRFLLGRVMQEPSGAFPRGTLLINVLGSLALGFLARTLDRPDMSPAVRLGMTVGLCGGFTTFSTFSAETLGLIAEDRFGRALMYVAASVVLCVASTYVGLMTARTLE